MLPADSGDTCEGRTAADNATVRTVFVVGPDKKIKLMLSYPMSTGRNFDEVLRVVDSMQLTAKHKVATPVNWKQGDDVIILPAVSDEEAKQKYPGGWKAPRPYLRIVPQPRVGAPPARMVRGDPQAILSAVPGARFLPYRRRGRQAPPPSLTRNATPTNTSPLPPSTRSRSSTYS